MEAPILFPQDPPPPVQCCKKCGTKVDGPQCKKCGFWHELVQGVGEAIGEAKFGE